MRRFPIPAGRFEIIRCKPLPRLAYSVLHRFPGRNAAGGIRVLYTISAYGDGAGNRLLRRLAFEKPGEEACNRTITGSRRSGDIDLIAGGQ